MTFGMMDLLLVSLSRSNTKYHLSKLPDRSGLYEANDKVSRALHIQCVYKLLYIFYKKIFFYMTDDLH